jgi:mono/diheme cytochrome c family protein
MAAPPWSADDERYLLQRRFLESLWPAGEPAVALSFEVAPPAQSGPSDGDRAAGCALFARACEGCHGEGGEGGPAGLGPSLWERALWPDAYRAHIRLSGPTPATVPGTLYSGLLGNRMPFFSRQRLNDAEVEDIVAYLEVAADPARRPCDRVDVGQPVLVRAGTIVTIDHGVRGRVEQWSDRTIRLRDFFYDGGGPPGVHVWLYRKDPADFHAILRGVPISEDLVRATPYVDVDLEYPIPAEVSDDAFNTVSIWCTELQSNYGEAVLEE